MRHWTGHLARRGLGELISLTDEASRREESSASRAKGVWASNGRFLSRGVLGARGLLCRHVDGSQGFALRLSHPHAFPRLGHSLKRGKVVERHSPSLMISLPQLIAQDCSNRDIAQRLCLSEKTVKTHVTKILKKFQYHTAISGRMTGPIVERKTPTRLKGRPVPHAAPHGIE
jgi:hypothetical protein